jgi:hypothetical protein
MSLVSYYISYKLIELLSTPFTDWDAYKEGIIDEKGDTIHQPILTDEKKSFGFFEKIVRKIKQLMEKAIGPSRAAAVLSTIYLIKEHNEETSKVVMNYCLKNCSDLQEYLKYSNRLIEHFSNVVSENGHQIIKKGKYLLEGKEIEISEDLTYFDRFYGIPIFEYKNKDERIIFTRGELDEKET